ncbi:MAG: discoidin domain-containing protein, partial [Clostridia bacterium]|nr:discoidin domain-containing protein [Clostridia bacterium]
MTSCEKPITEPYVLENIRVWPESGTVMTESEGKYSLTLDENIPEELEFTDWYNATHKEKNPVDRVSLFIDIGFPAPNGTVELKGANCAYKVYASDDGYNFTKFLGEFDTDTFSFNTDSKAFNIVFEKDSVSLSGITVTALPYAKKTLLSVGASYVWEGTGMKAYSDKEGLKLTDGVYFTGDDSVVAAKTSHEQDGLTQKKGNIITLDLGEVKNVSEVSLSAFISGDIKAVVPTRISVRYSTDGENWEDFGQSFLVEAKNRQSRFTVTRPATVEARYIKVFTYADGIFATDEIEVWGASTPVTLHTPYSEAAFPVGDVNTITSAGDKALTDGIVNAGVKIDGELSIKAKGAVNAINILSTAEIKDISPAGKVIRNSAAGLHTTLILLE